jgi:hypothetical protein
VSAELDRSVCASGRFGGESTAEVLGAAVELGGAEGGFERGEGLGRGTVDGTGVGVGVDFGCGVGVGATAIGLGGGAEADFGTGLGRGPEVGLGVGLGLVAALRRGVGLGLGIDCAAESGAAVPSGGVLVAVSGWLLGLGEADGSGSAAPGVPGPASVPGVRVAASVDGVARGEVSELVAEGVAGDDGAAYVEPSPCTSVEPPWVGEPGAGSGSPLGAGLGRGTDEPLFGPGPDLGVGLGRNAGLETATPDCVEVLVRSGVLGSSGTSGSPESPGWFGLFG